MQPDSTILGMWYLLLTTLSLEISLRYLPLQQLQFLHYFLARSWVNFGILSASWDREPGSFFGVENIPMNIERAKAAFKPATQNFEENS